MELALRDRVGAVKGAGKKKKKELGGRPETKYGKCIRNEENVVWKEIL